VPAADDVQRLFTRRADAYVEYAQAFRHRQGIAAALVSSGLLRPGQRILDAGCGTGLSILALTDALRTRGFACPSIDAFDLTEAMLDRCRETVRAALPPVEFRQADVLHLSEQVPASWDGYDLIVCAAMLEYVRRDSLTAAVAALGERLEPGGRLFAVITRSSFYATRWIWRCEGYTEREIRSAFTDAGLADVVFRRYPWRYGWLNVGNHIAVATRSR